MLVSTTGGTTGFSVPSGATGSSISQFVSGYNTGSSSISGTATVNVNSTGLLDFRTIGGGTTGNYLVPSVTTTGTFWTAPLAAGFVDNISITLPTGQGFENNANFAFAIVGAFDPSLSAVSGTTGYVSSFAGTDSTDASVGYNRSLAVGGSLRLDLVTVSGIVPVPEPSTMALVGAGLALGAWAIVRRRVHRASPDAAGSGV
ncbi:MAG: PEP-CTERM sorting domain-containing protein [Planctomycetota bacterium]